MNFQEFKDRAKKLYKRGLIETPEYGTWLNMKSRCNHPQGRDGIHYDGVEVCPEWEYSFESFYLDMGDRPSNVHSIDRINPKKGYSKENCRWTTSQIQARNSKRTRSNGLPKGVGMLPGGRWRARIQVDKGYRLHLGVFDDIFHAAAAKISAENFYWGAEK